MGAFKTLLAALAATLFCLATSYGQGTESRSKTITSVLREPLPPEELKCSIDGNKIVIQGSTYDYTVDRNSGAIVGLHVKREGQAVIRLTEPVSVTIGDYNVAGEGNRGATSIVSEGAGKIVLRTAGTLKSLLQHGPDLPYTLISSFFNDGVVVSQWTLSPQQDLPVAEIRHEVAATGAFRHYLHKTRDNHGAGAPWGSLPPAGTSVRFSTLTSCLQVFGPKAALAIFTDSGAMHSTAGLDTAVVKVQASREENATLSLTQHVVNSDVGSEGYVLKAHTPFTFRVGISIAPNRARHPRWRDLRMFIWVGDEKHPYPTDREILDAAQLGYTLFQMHRVGTPGEPRPPAQELERVIKTVHNAGMLFLWTANADLMYNTAPGVRDLKSTGKWPLWQGFNYGGRYTASMDRYCDMAATCLASPNGLADYRLACDSRMMDRYRVDGMYIDDNLAYANCTLWKEHGHPQKVYDCLIELHEMNWRRRELLRNRCPHIVLIDHCTTAMVLPVICDFDGHLFGEGYSFSSIEKYWAFFAAIQYMYAQGCIWPGDTESTRCGTRLAYNFDLLSGGGQYNYLDWRLYPEKFPYAKGVTKDEPPLVKAYNLAQFYFGMYESTPYYFAESGGLFSTSARLTYATIYHNEVWKDWLVVVANMNAEASETGLAIHSPERLGFRQDGNYVLHDVKARSNKRIEGNLLWKNGIAKVRVPERGMVLLYVREIPQDRPFHLWGGKRIAERWDAGSQALNLELHGPPGSEDEMLVGLGAKSVRQVKVNGSNAQFYLDPVQRLVHGRLTFTADPLRIEVTCSDKTVGTLPERFTEPLPLPDR
jgi:hypothetical protein